MKRILLSLIAAILSLCATAEPVRPVGPWNGAIRVGFNKLPIVLNFSEDLSVTLDSPLQGAEGIPAEASMAGDTLTVSIPVLGASFRGICTSEKIAGTFSQNGMKFPLDLVPGKYIPQRPQTPQPPFLYPMREVEFVNPADSTTLSGTLSLPPQYSLPMMKDFPAVVFISGSGLQNRDEEIAGHKPFAVLAHQLALNGIASLRYDDRGFGRSGGDASHATSATFASDARAALQYLRANVDRLGKIGVIGHSEGGTIAFMLAADGACDFVVDMAGATMRGDSILLDQNRKAMAKIYDVHVADEYVEGLRRVLEFMQSNPTVTEAPALTFDDLTNLPQGLKDNLRTIIAHRNPWIDAFISFSPVPAINATHVPVLALGGTLDVQVDSDTNLSALYNNLPKDTPLVIHEYPGLNHLFQHATTGMPDEYPTIDETIADEVIIDIIRWILDL